MKQDLKHVTEVSAIFEVYVSRAKVDSLASDLVYELSIRDDIHRFNIEVKGFDGIGGIKLNVTAISPAIDDTLSKGVNWGFVVQKVLDVLNPDDSIDSFSYSYKINQVDNYDDDWMLGA